VDNIAAVDIDAEIGSVAPSTLTSVPMTRRSSGELAGACSSLAGVCGSSLPSRPQLDVLCCLRRTNRAHCGVVVACRPGHALDSEASLTVDDVSEHPAPLGIEREVIECSALVQLRPQPGASELGSPGPSQGGLAGNGPAALADG
jgi:hypothetical protein